MRNRSVFSLAHRQATAQTSTVGSKVLEPWFYIAACCGIADDETFAPGSGASKQDDVSDAEPVKPKSKMKIA